MLLAVREEMLAVNLALGAETRVAQLAPIRHIFALKHLLPVLLELDERDCAVDLLELLRKSQVLFLHLFALLELVQDS